MSDVATWTSFAAALRQTGLNLFAASNVRITEDGAADLKVLGLMLLARTLSNLKGALIMLREDLIVEARVLARCCYWTSSHRHREETGEFRSIQVFDFVKHAPDHDTVLKRYETSLDAMATTRRPYTR